MKKIILILAITGVLISCSNKDETVKKDIVAEVSVVKDVTVVSIEEAVIETMEVVEMENEKPVLTDEDYKSVSEPIKKVVKKPVKQTKPAINPADAEIVVEDVIMETSVDDAVDTDVEKQIAVTETENKVVEVETPKEESGSNKTLFGILGAILVAAAAIFVFKKK